MKNFVSINRTFALAIIVVVLWSLYRFAQLNTGDQNVQHIPEFVDDSGIMSNCERYTVTSIEENQDAVR